MFTLRMVVIVIVIVNVDFPRWEISLSIFF